jgi:hypothetical protein
MVITRGTGTGKTTIIRATLMIFGRLVIHIPLAAPIKWFSTKTAGDLFS